jgi:DCN1-like protein 1/2
MRLPTVEQEIRDPNQFKELYHFTFNYAKNPGQKGLDLEMAIAYWNIVLRGRFKFLDIWCQFLTVSQFSCHVTSDCFVAKFVYWS